MGLENQAGGFGAVYPVLREMEETGRIRRGHFVEGMTSAQLAVPGAVDRMRSLRDRPLNPQAVLLAATDPAQPYGIQLPWPESRKQASKPRRALGCYVILVDGVPSLFIDKGGERVLCFEDESQQSGAIRLERGLRVLVRGVVRMGRNRLSVETIDGERARGSGLVDAFVRAGFRAGYRGLEIDRPAPGGNLASEAEEDERDEANRHVAGQSEALN
jgi:ATP-dependent Lhr-like helicase